MPFTSALYYPWIDILDEQWLKTAVLYWDSVRTIVPASLDNPYSGALARNLQSAGFLIPLLVDPDMDEINHLAKDAVAFLDTSIGGELLPLVGNHRGPRRLLEKRRNMWGANASLHKDKVAWLLRGMLEQRQAVSRSSEWLEVDDAFAAYYMTLLATTLSERHGLALLTSLPNTETLALAQRLDAQLAARSKSPTQWMPPRLAQGMLAHLAIERLSLEPTTPIETLLRFKQDHSAELALFRSKVEQLTAAVTLDLPAEALRQNVLDSYTNDVVPAISSLKDALTSSGIRWLGEGLLRISFLSAGSSSMLLAAGLSVPTALLAGAGLSLMVSGVIYNTDRADALRANPYSYLLMLGKRLR